jgi:hypothetical protein
LPGLISPFRIREVGSSARGTSSPFRLGAEGAYQDALED